jgi:hypothetical protein
MNHRFLIEKKNEITGEGNNSNKEIGSKSIDSRESKS